MIVESYTRERVEEILRSKLQIDPNHRLHFCNSGMVLVTDCDIKHKASGQDATPIPAIAGSGYGTNAMERKT